MELTRTRRRGALTALLTVGIAAGAATPALGQDATPAAGAPTPTGAGAIFFHPDGTSAGHWDFLRIVEHGPDGRSNWDQLSEIAPYAGHMTDRITGTSNGGAVTHAIGTRTYTGSFGLDETGAEYPSANGTTNSIMEEAVAAGLGTALLQTGSIIEPGTAAFVAEAPTRGDYEEIALEVVESGVDIMLGAGEQWLLPEGVAGQHCEAGARTDGLNLIERAEELGYEVVYTAEELAAVPADAAKVLGVFACDHTFNDDRTEEDLRAEGLPNFSETAPTIGEMFAFALPRVSANPNGFFVVAEEEGTDNLCNDGNAAGCLEALQRTDEAFGQVAEFVNQHGNTFLVTASDSAAGGLAVVAYEEPEVEAGAAATPVAAMAPATTEEGAPCDGVEGTGTAPFMTAPDANGTSFPFVVCWATYDDIGSGVIARAHGLNAAELLPASGIDNTDIYRMLYATLFGETLP